MMTYGTRGKEKSHAEVFTPAGVVFEMILADGIRPLLQDVDKTILDPAVGQGQFPCAELVWKLFFAIDSLDEVKALRALKSLYGIDIQPSSVATTREHLLQTLCDAFNFFTGKKFSRLNVARMIVDDNFICGDSLKIMKQWAEPQLSLF
ncbi:MAG: hypothetical protein IKP64_14145 [Selenomonadaceae bacterium]|nr:hypothetical protein [Clostridia bacterium]MBR4384683.1 hypothetical protein [Selenomonadaceae bacterium]